MSANRDIAKTYYPPTQAQFEEILDNVVFTDELSAIYGVKVEIFSTTGSDLAYELENLEGKTIVAVKVGQAFLADTDYSLATTTFTLTDAFTAGTVVRVLYI